MLCPAALNVITHLAIHAGTAVESIATVLDWQLRKQQQKQQQQQLEKPP